MIIGFEESEYNRSLPLYAAPIEDCSAADGAIQTLMTSGNIALGTAAFSYFLAWRMRGVVVHPELFVVAGVVYDAAGVALFAAAYGVHLKRVRGALGRTDDELDAFEGAEDLESSGRWGVPTNHSS